MGCVFFYFLSTTVTVVVAMVNLDEKCKQTFVLPNFGQCEMMFAVCFEMGLIGKSNKAQSKKRKKRHWRSIGGQKSF